MTEVDVATGEIVPLAVGRLTPEQTRERAAWVREVTKAALVEGTDFGVIPGTERPALLKPGAEMLLLAAGLGFTIARIDDQDSASHQGVTYRCTVRRGELVLAECDGYAGYDESRYYRSAEESERQERAYAKKDRREPREDRFVEYRAPWNTLVKMSQKRALVGAALNAVAGSGLFVTDDDDQGQAQGSRTQPARSPRRPRRDEGPPPDYYDDLPEARGVGVAHPPRYDPTDATPSR